MKRVKKVVIRIFTLMLLLPILVFTIGIIKPMERVKAKTSWYPTTAKAYYDWAVSNGVVNEAVYDPGDDTIKFITKGMVGTTGTKYRTIGWQVRWEIDWEIKLWYVLQRDGAYLKTISSQTVDGYEYALYGVKYSDLKALIKSKFSGVVAGEKIDLAPMYGIRLDAVFTIVENGTVKGKIDGDGRVNSSYPEVYFNQGSFVSTSANLPSISVKDPTALKLSGTVRSTAYDSSVHTYTHGKGNGITGARAWDSVSRNGFGNYFNKKVTVLGEARYPYHKAAVVAEYAYHNPSTDIYYAKPGAIVRYTNVGASDYGPLFASYFRLYRPSGGGDIRAYHRWPEASDSINVFQGADLSWAKITSMYEGTERGGGMRAHWFFKVNEDNTTVYLQSYYAIVINDTTYCGPGSSYLTTHTFRTDGTAPNKPTFTQSHAGWTNTDVTVTIEHGEDNSGGSGTKATYYRYYNKDTSKWTDWSSFTTKESSKTLTFTNSCSEYTVEAYSVDNVGNVGGTSSTKVYIDKIKPTKPIVTSTNTNWTNTDVTVTIKHGSDSLSGLKYTTYRYYSSKSATWSSWVSFFSDPSRTITFSDDGSYLIQADTYDNAGNSSGHQELTVYVDKTKPTVTFSPKSQSWTNQDISVSMTPSDTGSGVKQWRYRTGTYNTSTGATTWNAWGSYLTSTAAQTVSFKGTGVYVIQAEVTDNAGNTSTSSSGKYYIDKVLPNGSIKPSTQSTWSNKPVTVNFNVEDSHSGIDYWQYRKSVDGGRTSTGWGQMVKTTGSNTGTLVLNTSGIWLIQMEIKDKAGNIRSIGNKNQIESSLYYLDFDKPSGSFSPNSQDNWTALDVNVAFTPTDALSGVKRWRYRLGVYDYKTNTTVWQNWGAYIENGNVGNIVLNQSGGWIIQAEVEDKAGNIQTVTSGKYYIDKDNATEPIISVPTSGWTNKDVTVTIKHGTDGYSGVALTRFRYFNNVKNTWTSWDKFYAGTSYTTFTLTENGGYTIEAQTDDNVGRVSNKVSANVYIDKIKPVVTADKANGKYLMPLTVTLTYSDTLSGISNADKKYAWSTSTATPTSWSVYTSPVTSNTSGVQYLHYWVRDKAGNETTGYFTYQMFPTNTKPVANFTVSPNPQMAKEPLTYTDTSYAGDSWDTIVAKEWSYSRDGGVTWSTATATPPNSFSDVGNYKIRLRVKDKGNELSAGMWSGYCIRDLVIEPNIGVTASVTPKPTKAGQEVTFNIDTEGYVEKVWITFPNDFNVLDSSLPLTTDITPQRTSSLAIKYITPINIGRTISDSGVRLRQPYVITVSVRNTGGNTAAVDLYLDIKGSVLDNIITEILWN